MSDTVISVEKVSKAYRLGQIGGGTLREDFARWSAKLRGKPDPLLKIGEEHHARKMGEQFWALDDISFKVGQGEVLGIIGRNGAGKSTLLKILSQVTTPTSGEIKIKGRIASLLEVGTGFHPELTGRENMFLNGAILGMTKAEIRRKFDEIVAFSEIEEFIDTPVKRYSSGMYVRLAFAVAAHMEPEILICDEVLAVGDAQFQKKCMGKMQDVSRRQGRTVLFVSHNLQAVSALCNRGVYLRNGRVVCVDETKKVLDAYLSDMPQADRSENPVQRHQGTGEYQYTFANPSQESFLSTERKSLEFEINCIKKMTERMWLSAHVVNAKDNVIVQCDSRLMGLWVSDAPKIKGTFYFDTPWLKPGKYHIDLFLCSRMGIIDHWENACSITISPMLPYAETISDDGVADGWVFANFNWAIGKP